MKKAEENGADAIEPPELVTFIQKVKKPGRSQSLIKIYQDETAVTRTLCFFHSVNEETRCKVFSHEWTDYPSSLFETGPRLTQGYTMRKGCKSYFVKALSSQVDTTFKQPNLLPESILSSVYLIDMMSFVQKDQHFGAKTFGQLLSRYIAKFMQIKPVGCTLINLVGDRYDFDGQCTLKGDERQRREQFEKVKEFHPSHNLEIPNWKDLMKNPNNKANLLTYIAFSVSKQPEILHRSMTFISGGMMEDGDQTIILRNGVSEGVGELSCKTTKRQIRECLLIWPNVFKTLDRPEPLSMPQIPIL